MEGISTAAEPGTLIKNNQWKKRDKSDENKYKLYFSNYRVHPEEFIKQESSTNENYRAYD